MISYNEIRQNRRLIDYKELKPHVIANANIFVIKMEKRPVNKLHQKRLFEYD